VFPTLLFNEIFVLYFKDSCFCSSENSNVSVAVNAPHATTSAFGGLDAGDDCAALLDGTRKPVSQFAADGTVREFDFRQYLFSRQASVLFFLGVCFPELALSEHCGPFLICGIALFCVAIQRAHLQTLLR
jgi:hypothetical protein